jgi:hypothetical protein
MTKSNVAAGGPIAKTALNSNLCTHRSSPWAREVLQQDNGFIGVGAHQHQYGHAGDSGNTQSHNGSLQE